MFSVWGEPWYVYYETHPEAGGWLESVVKESPQTHTCNVGSRKSATVSYRHDVTEEIKCVCLCLTFLNIPGISTLDRTRFVKIF